MEPIIMESLTDFALVQQFWNSDMNIFAMASQPDWHCLVTITWTQKHIILHASQKAELKALPRQTLH